MEKVEGRILLRRCKMQMREEFLTQIPRLRGEAVSTKFCFDDCIATYAKYVDSDYQMMFLDSWEIDWKKDSSVPYFLRLTLEDKLVSKVNEIYGIAISFHFEPLQEAKSLMEEEIQKGNILAIFMDPYYVPWDRGYHIYHTEGHSFFITGYENGIYMCSDPYFGKLNMELPEMELIDGYRWFITFKKRERKSNQTKYENKMEYKKILAETLSSDSFIKYFENMSQICKEFSDEKLINEYLFQNNNTMDFGEIMNDICDNRVRFAIMLLYIGEKEPQIGELLTEQVEKLLYIAERWKICQASMTKAIICKRAKLIVENIPNRLTQILHLEKQWVQQVQEIIMECGEKENNILQKKDKGKKIETVYRMDDAPLQSKYCFVPLTTYYNNQGVGKRNSATADLTGVDEFFLCDTFPKTGIWDVLGMKFFLFNEEGEKDNIVCKSQVIEVSEDEYDTLLILGCSEWGCFRDNVVVQYTDGSVQHFMLLFYDFVTEGVIGDSNDTACTSHTVKRIDGEFVEIETDHHLFVNRCKLEKGKKVKSITLPDCSNIHIFALTFLV